MFHYLFFYYHPFSVFNIYYNCLVLCAYFMASSLYLRRVILRLFYSDQVTEGCDVQDGFVRTNAVTKLQDIYTTSAYRKL